MSGIEYKITLDFKLTDKGKDKIKKNNKKIQDVRKEIEILLNELLEYELKPDQFDSANIEIKIKSKCYK